MGDEEFFSFEQRPGEADRRWMDKSLNLLLVVVMVAVVGGLLWMVIGPTTSPCKDAPAGQPIEDPHNPGSFIVCKG